MRFLTLKDGTDLRPALFAAGFAVMYLSASAALAVLVIVHLRTIGSGWIVSLFAGAFVTLIGFLVLFFLHYWFFRCVTASFRRVRLFLIRWRRHDRAA